MADKVTSSAQLLSKVLGLEDAQKALRRWGAKTAVTDQTGAPMRMYHGTTADIRKFSNEDAPYRGGILSFFSDSPKFASEYAGANSGANVLPVYLDVRNPFDFRKHSALADDFYEETGGIRDSVEANRILLGIGKADDLFDGPAWADKLSAADFRSAVERGSWDALEAPEFVEWLRAGGHDGIITKENGAINYGVFEPTQIKSAIGNRGAYDPTDPDITKANGGRVELDRLRKRLRGGGE